MDKIVIVLPFLPPSLNRVAGRGPYNITLHLEAYCDPAHPRTEIIIEEV